MAVRRLGCADGGIGESATIDRFAERGLLRAQEGQDYIALSPLVRQRSYPWLLTAVRRSLYSSRWRPRCARSAGRAPGRCARESGAQRRQARHLERCVRAKPVVGSQLDDVGVERGDAEISGRGNAMMPVDHEVSLADLNNVDRWELAGWKPPLHFLGALLELGLQGMEAAVKVATAPSRTDDARHRNGTDPPCDLRSQSEASANVVEIEERAASAVAEHPT